MGDETTLANNPRGATVCHEGIALAVLTTVAVILRLTARWKTKAKFAADDILIVISLGPFYVMVVLSYLGKYLIFSGLYGLTDVSSGDRRAPWCAAVEAQTF